MTQTLLLAFVLMSSVSGLAARDAAAADVTCYNDDSQDVINQDELRVPLLGGQASMPQPMDCGLGPSVAIDQDGAVFVNGEEVYDRRYIDPAIEARVAPSGAVAILTQQGSLYLYRNGQLATWLAAGVHSVREFRMARDGALIAATQFGVLLLNGREVAPVSTVNRLYAGASGRLVALMNDGAVLDQRGALYNLITDGAVAAKIAADGTVVWRTQNGAVGSTRNPHLYDLTVDPALSFKVNPRGRVAYLTQGGQLGRDGTRLSNGVTQTLQYRIDHSGAVTATDADGRAHYYK